MFELAMVNKPSVFELLRFDCIMSETVLYSGFCVFSYFALNIWFDISCESYPNELKCQKKSL